MVAAIAMDGKLTRAVAVTLDYGCRWGIEPMFSDFKSRGFDLQKSQMKLPGRLLKKMVLLVALAMRVCTAGKESKVATNVIALGFFCAITTGLPCACVLDCRQ